MTSITSFCAQQREWLAAELQSENDSVDISNQKGGADREGHRSSVLSGLLAEEISVGLYGRTVVTLTRSTSNPSASDAPKTTGGDKTTQQSALLPAHRFTTGDEVEIRSKTSSAKQNQKGVVSQVTDVSISVALFGKQQTSKTNDSEDGSEMSDDILNSGVPLLLVPSRSIEVHKKYLSALTTLEKKGMDHPVAGNVVRALFESPPDHIHESAPSANKESDQEEFVPFNSKLDDSQIEAIRFALNDGNRIACILGPPGTGKTTTLVELIRQAVMRNKKVLVAAPSNVAVDNLLARLVATPSDSNHDTNKKRARRKASQHSKLRVVRLGHPARLQKEILPFSLEALVSASDGTEIVRQVRQELQSFLHVLSNPKSRGNEKRVAYREMKSLRQEVRQREEKVVRELLTSAQVVLSTCVGSGNSMLNSFANGNEGGFDIVVIDEAAQALEAACWIPALRGKRLILAGDHKQLPPTIQSSQHDVSKGLGTTMFERVMQLYKDDDPAIVVGRVSRMLRVQYRMNENIANWASNAMYGGHLSTHESVAHRTLAQLANAKEVKMEEDDSDFDPMLLIDTAGCGMHEGVNTAGSRFNEMEAEIVGQHCRRLIACGVPPHQIAIITPYNGQVELLRSTLLTDLPGLEIRSVDGFQGGEREAVVLSMVRSSGRGGKDGIGFLRDDRRLNVAVTRAKRHCCVVADSETVSQSSFIKSLLDWVEEYGQTRSALEFVAADQESGFVDDQIQSDLVAAEEELRKLEMDSKPKASKLEMDSKPKASKLEMDSKPKASSSKLTRDSEAKLKGRVEAFANGAKEGEVLRLDSELSRNDRRIVHETAERLGLEHQSEGVEGVDRRLTLRKPKAESVQKQNQTSSGVQNEPPVVNEPEEVPVSQPFAALDTAGSESDNEVNADEGGKKESPANALLGDLARERAERAKQRTQQPNVAQVLQGQQGQQRSGGAKKKNGKKKGKKLGGKPKPAPQKVDEDDDLDDMAFLDSQIEKVQNSHGRTVDGKGNYRTVINGILTSKPGKPEKKKNSAASAALQNKLRKAQEGRKGNPKKK